MYLCPAITQGCCSLYDQFNMFTNWQDEIKPKIKKYFTNINKKIEHTLSLVKMVNELNLGDKINGLKMKLDAKALLKRKLQIIKSVDIEEAMVKAQDYHRKLMKRQIKMRSAFYCVLCDWQNHRYFDMVNRTIYMNGSTCSTLAENTIAFSYILNIKVVPTLIRLSDLLSKLLNSSHAIKIRIYKYTEIRRDVMRCAKAFEAGGSLDKICKKYCKNYNFNANSPVLEGYQVFFNKIMNSLTIYLQAEGHMINERKLASLVYTTDKLSSERNLSTAYFTKEQLASIKDPYEKKDVDPIYNTYILNEMFNYQDDYQKDRETGYENFVKNKLHYFDVQLDFANESQDKIFKTSSNVVVDLENFITDFRIHGIDIPKHSENNNMSSTMKELISHLKLKTKHKIFYEKLDPNILNFMNDITNKDVKRFHRDNFLRFTDYSMSLKRDEIMNKMMLEQDEAAVQEQAQAQAQDQDQQNNANQNQSGSQESTEQDQNSV